jgi:hypothetical protein
MMKFVLRCGIAYLALSYHLLKTSSGPTPRATVMSRSSSAADGNGGGTKCCRIKINSSRIACSKDSDLLLTCSSNTATKQHLAQRRSLQQFLEIPSCFCSFPLHPQAAILPIIGLVIYPPVSIENILLLLITGLRSSPCLQCSALFSIGWMAGIIISLPQVVPQALLLSS